MNTTVKARLESVQLGEPQTYKNITILPLIAPADGTIQYRTLGEALRTWDIAITEVSAAGSVPDLMVVNRGNRPVLLVDGEELAGAKQNRVLNTSILIKAVSETKISVSCTEQGRWSYASKAFTQGVARGLACLGLFSDTPTGEWRLDNSMVLFFLLAASLISAWPIFVTASVSV